MDDVAKHNNVGSSASGCSSRRRQCGDDRGSRVDGGEPEGGGRREGGATAVEEEAS